MSVTLSKYDLDFKSSMFDTLASLNLASRISALLFFFFRMMELEFEWSCAVLSYL